MSVAYGKGPRGKATKLHAELVRARGRCESCGSTRTLQCAHVIPRRHAATRTDENAAFCLCSTCHRHYTEWPFEWVEFVVGKIGQVGYDELYRKSHTVTKVDWNEEVKRLQALLKEVRDDSERTQDPG